MAAATWPPTPGCSTTGRAAAARAAPHPRMGQPRRSPRRRRAPGRRRRPRAGRGDGLAEVVAQRRPALVRANVFPAGRAGRPTGTGTSTTSSWPTRRRPSRPRRTRRWRGSRSTPCPRTGSRTWTSFWPCWCRSCGGPRVQAGSSADAAVRAALCFLGVIRPEFWTNPAQNRSAAASSKRLQEGPRRFDVAPLGGAAADADPQRRMPVEHGPGEQGGPGRVGRVDQGVGGGVAIDVAEAHQVEGGGAASSKRASASTHPASSAAHATWRRIMARAGSGPSAGA